MPFTYKKCYFPIPKLLWLGFTGETIFTDKKEYHILAKPFSSDIIVYELHIFIVFYTIYLPMYRDTSKKKKFNNSAKQIFKKLIKPRRFLMIGVMQGYIFESKMTTSGISKHQI